MASNKNAPKTLSPEEEAELVKLEEEEVAKAAQLAVEAAAAAVPPPLPAPAPKLVGDIPVVCLKTEPFCSLGGRNYSLQKGQEIMMDPSHAEELSFGKWVAIVSVVGSK